jgi:phosphoribosylpyrophosphate synthetase
MRQIQGFLTPGGSSSADIVFSEHLRKDRDTRETDVVSPDMGSVGRARIFAILSARPLPFGTSARPNEN